MENPTSNPIVKDDNKVSPIIAPAQTTPLKPVGSQTAKTPEPVKTVPVDQKATENVGKSH